MIIHIFHTRSSQVHLFVGLTAESFLFKVGNYMANALRFPTKNEINRGYFCFVWICLSEVYGNAGRLAARVFRNCRHQVPSIYWIELLQILTSDTAASRQQCSHSVHFSLINRLKSTGWTNKLNILTIVRSVHTVFMCFVFVWEQTATYVTYIKKTDWFL
jgi:hypothetical protein